MTQDPSTADQLSVAFARMSGLLLSEETVATALGLVTSLAVATIPGTVGAGISLMRDARKTTSAATDPVVERADALQYELDQGPCLAAWRDRQVFRVDDTSTETRWSKWNRAVASLGLRSVLSAPLLIHGDSLGAVKLYSDRPDAYGDHDAHVLEMFAAQAAILLANVQSLENAQQVSAQLKEALRSRDVIAVAKGILMATDGVDEHTAFRTLARSSQRDDEKLRDLAQRIVDSASRTRP